jgi:hypothetical protein
MKKCPQCKTLNDDARKWCESCAKVFGADVETVEPTPEIEIDIHPPLETKKRVTCPFCHVSGQVYTTSRVTTGGVIVCIALLVLCFPLFWVPLLTMTERHAYCGACSLRINA